MENKKIFSLFGYISRRNYIANILALDIIKSFCIALCLYVNLALFSNIVYFICSLIILFGLFCSFSKRLSDIKGDKLSYGQYVFSFIISLLYSLLNFVPLWNYVQDIGYYRQTYIFTLILLFILVIFACIKGKYNIETYDKYCFNFGAFFGTWIWGLLNKAYPSLLIFALFIISFLANYKMYCITYPQAVISQYNLYAVFGSILWAIISIPTLKFMFLCGLKGSEWIKKDKVKSQKIQGVIAFILFFIIIIAPLIVFFAKLYLEPYYDFFQNANRISNISFSKPFNYNDINNKRSYESHLSHVEFVNDIYKIKKYEYKEGKYIYYINSYYWNINSGFFADNGFKLMIFGALLFNVRMSEYYDNGIQRPVKGLHNKVKIYSFDNQNEILFDADIDNELLEKKPTLFNVIRIIPLIKIK